MSGKPLTLKERKFMDRLLAKWRAGKLKDRDMVKVLFSLRVRDGYRIRPQSEHSARMK